MQDMVAFKVQILTKLQFYRCQNVLNIYSQQYILRLRPRY